jgi:hypothetical protein
VEFHSWFSYLDDECRHHGGIGVLLDGEVCHVALCLIAFLLATIVGPMALLLEVSTLFADGVIYGGWRCHWLMLNLADLAPGVCVRAVTASAVSAASTVSVAALLFSFL